MADRPLRPATDHRLGGPLPRQPANRPQPPPPAAPKDLCQPLPLEGPDHTELPRVSAGYPLPVGRLATCSSPVRHGRAPKGLPFDLHALGTPPALILSQDQTLHQCRTHLGRPPSPEGTPWVGPDAGLSLRCSAPSPPRSRSEPARSPKRVPHAPRRPAIMRPFRSFGMTLPRHAASSSAHHHTPRATTCQPPPVSLRPRFRPPRRPLGARPCASLVNVPLETFMDSHPVSQSCPRSRGLTNSSRPRCECQGIINTDFWHA